MLSSPSLMAALLAIGHITILGPLVSGREANQATVSTVQPAHSDTGVGEYYTEAQALRGKELFNRNCGYCHYVDLDKQPTISGIRGGALAPRLVQRIADGIARYPSVYYMFRRLDYMPVNDVDSVSPQQKADILAYLLEKNGVRPGKEELRADYASMKAMPLPAEQGFLHLFNGRDLRGWQFVLGYHCTPEPEGCGRTEPGTTFWAKDGVLATNGKIHGMMYTQKKYKNFTLRVEQRVPAPWDDIDDLIQDQTGILIFVSGTMRTWADNFIEVEGRYYDLLGVGTTPGGVLKTKNTVDNEARRHAIKRVNEWQRIEIVSKAGVVKNYLNGTLISTVEFLQDPEPGFIAFQSQGGPVEWRNIRIKEE